MACDQTYGSHLRFQGVGQRINLMNAIDGKEGDNLGIWNFGGDTELAHERSTCHRHNGYKVYAADLGT